MKIVAILSVAQLEISHVLNGTTPEIQHRKWDTRLNGVKVIAKNESVLLKPGDKIELLEGLYEHELIILKSEPEIRESNKIEWWIYSLWESQKFSVIKF